MDVDVDIDVARLAVQLSSRGFVAIENALPTALLRRLNEGCHDSRDVPFAPGGMGRGRGRDAGLRGDAIRWLEDANRTDHEYLAFMERLRVGLNERLYLGLLHYECHYAVYEVGARYVRHLDSLAGQTNRLLSTVVYLNSEWAQPDGGELLLYGDASATVLARILPQPGLMVLFLSEDIPHEVLAATKTRHSIAGWWSGRSQARADSRRARNGTLA